MANYDARSFLLFIISIPEYFYWLSNMIGMLCLLYIEKNDEMDRVKENALGQSDQIGGEDWTK
jgi:hypothetical protein